MIDINAAKAELLTQGYSDDNVEGKIAQDILLKAIEQSGMKANVTIKGGVVMANLTNDVRRATMDLDVDLMRYPISDEGIEAMVSRMNCIEGVSITRIGDIIELRQQNYRGKRIYLSLRDERGVAIQTKIDIGVHVKEEVTQSEYPFDVRMISEDDALLFANSPEQVFVEKLKSLLRLGPISSRAKDVYDMAYLCDLVRREEMLHMIDVFIYQDERMRERSIADIVRRMRRTFEDPDYRARLSHPRANWLRKTVADVTAKVLSFVEGLA